jgi:hypothetical protein
MSPDLYLLTHSKFYLSNNMIAETCRALAYQGARLQIGPLAKLGSFKSTADNFLVKIVTISLASGPIRSLTSWYA